LVEEHVFILPAFKSSWRPQKECCMALKLVWRFVNTVSKDIIDAYREESQPEN
jgi:ABC-type uncharacterized transport system substrate-binding protein